MVPHNILKFIKLYLAAIFFFFIFRMILFISEMERIDTTVSTSDILLSFWMGIRFDVVITGYILLLPFLIISVLTISKQRSSIVHTGLRYYINGMFTLAFLICAVDIPYFNQFFARFSVSAFEWMDSPVFVLKMAMQEPRYWMFVLPFCLIIYVFYRITTGLFSEIGQNEKGKMIPGILFSILFLGFMLLGIRGRLDEKSPIRVGTAFFSDNAFLNQLGLNPNFTLIRSYLDSRKEENKKVSLMDENKAIFNVQKYLGITTPDDSFPLNRIVAQDSVQENKYNVVLIIMESMSVAKMTRHGNTFHLTPFLDSISNKGYYFDNAYTAGIHTFNGIFSSLFSFPALFRQHPLKGSTLKKYHGIFTALKKYDYSSIYFTTHDGQFDNVEGFLKANDCEQVISKDDYPSEKIKTTLGVPDDYMFEYSIPLLNELHAKNKPFVAAYMTTSDHGPYYIPEYFTPKNKDIKKQIVEYADFSLRKMISLSSKQKWFDNTIFVFVADHGSPLDSDYEMSLDYHHSPLLFYAPRIITDHKTFSDMAGQIDIFPTIMGLLQLPYTNNTLGINLLKEKRPYIYFSADDKYGVIDEEWFLMVNSEKKRSLYQYKTKSKNNFILDKPELAEKMDAYAKSNFQAYQFVLSNNKQ
ncbi:MAG: LTA synthase family protein [Saprospiraceae bacterium]|nr:LTA synthase family protein [Saprospiraceae bacterium]MBK9044512.1 LTA synthase family protein [Saprospiraceae bacterium]